MKMLQNLTGADLFGVHVKYLKLNVISLNLFFRGVEEHENGDVEMTLTIDDGRQGRNAVGLKKSIYFATVKYIDYQFRVVKVPF